MKKAVKIIHKTKNIDWKKFYWQNIKDIFIFSFLLISPLSCYATWSICVKSRLSEVRNSITVSWSRFRSKFPHAVICTVAKLTQSLKVKRKEMETVGVFFELQWKIQMNSWFPPKRPHTVNRARCQRQHSYLSWGRSPRRRTGAAGRTESTARRENSACLRRNLPPVTGSSHGDRLSVQRRPECVCRAAKPRTVLQSHHHPRTRTKTPASSACGTRYCEIPARFFLLSTRYTEEILFSVKLKPLAR